jgi:hypothetical protein
MDYNKTYMLKINLLREADDVLWLTDEFTGKEDIENLAEVLNNLGDLKSVFFKLNDGDKLFLTANMIGQCAFTLIEK